MNLRPLRPERSALPSCATPRWPRRASQSLAQSGPDLTSGSRPWACVSSLAIRMEVPRDFPSHTCPSERRNPTWVGKRCGLRRSGLRKPTWVGKRCGPRRSGLRMPTWVGKRRLRPGPANPLTETCPDQPADVHLTPVRPQVRADISLPLDSGSFTIRRMTETLPRASQSAAEAVE